MDVFSNDRAETQALHRPIHDVIDLEPGINIQYGRIGNRSEVELKSLKAYIESNLANGFIQQLSLAAAAPIFLAKKNDGGLQLCEDYRAFNRAKVNNLYPLSLISGMLDWLRRARIIMKLDIQNTYQLIRIKEGDK